MGDIKGTLDTLAHEGKGNSKSFKLTLFKKQRKKDLQKNVYNWTT